MPQIKINEIDQSVYTRVVTDDKVRVFVPGIASFGPGSSSELTDMNAVTFTDVTEFEKTFGYTEPEYNPFKDDVSRIYAKQLIKRGAAVTFIKVNSGTNAVFGIANTGSTDIPAASSYYKSAGKLVSAFALQTSTTKPSDWDSSYNTYYELIDNVYSTVTGASAPAWEANKYYKKVATTSAFNISDHQFAPQIASITAKYDGSFGNRLLVTFSPVDSINRNFTYQYSMVSVYRADISVDSKKDATTGNITNTVKIIGLHKLESHIVTTNPKDVNYFENVEFDFIKINPAPNAYQELSLIWSDLEANPTVTTNIGGFPEVPLRYIDSDGDTVYNEGALLVNGFDFDFSTNLKNALKQGFGGYVVSSGASGKNSWQNMNLWSIECYKQNGIIEKILSNIKNCYANYKDPYVYDFDFITSGGFLNETYVMTGEGGEPITQADYTTYTSANPPALILTTSDRNNQTLPVTGGTDIHLAMKDLVESRQDCIALFDVNPYWFKEQLPEYVERLNTSYGAVHAPWCYINNPEELGTLLMPPSFIFLYTMLSNLINNVEAQKWFPPAGVTRATARVVVKPLYEIGTVVLNQWQNDTLARVNPIMKLKQYGYVIYGNSTTYVAQDEYTHSALESLNIRLISNCVKKQIFNTCLKLAFEPNNSSLWMRFYDSMDKYLLFMKRNDGVYDYRIQMDEGTVTTDDINELRCPGKVWINPTRTAEFFDIDFILTEAGVTFTDTVEEGV